MSYIKSYILGLMSYVLFLMLYVIFIVQYILQPPEPTVRLFLCEALKQVSNRK
jgi:hypothetical protein